VIFIRGQNRWQPGAARHQQSTQTNPSRQDSHFLLSPLSIDISSIVKFSEFEQELGNTQIHNSLIVQQSGYWPEVENQPNLT